MAKKKLSAIDIADKLEVVRGAIADKKKIERTLTTQLLNALHDEQLKEAGNYQIVQTQTLKVADEALAMPYAQANMALKIDTTKVKELLRHTFDDPSKYGFEVVSRESVSPIRTAGSKEEAE